MFLLRYYKIIFLLILFIPGMEIISFSDCTNESFVMNCAGTIGNNKFLRSYTIQGIKAKKNEFSYVFSKGSNYIVRSCDETQEHDARVIVSLYDRNHKLKASNYDPVNKKFFFGFDYPCSVDGVYYLSFSFMEEAKKAPEKCCNITILGLKTS